SGRVPAALTNIVGLKPSLGLISNAGVVPACRTLDCVSVLALTVDDAFTALAALAGPDAADPYSRDRPLGRIGALPTGLRLGVPRRVCKQTFRQLDALALPTTPTVYTVEEVLADPIELNNRLGSYTNFANLLDLCALAVPASMRPDGAPFGITLVAPAGEDAALASIGRAFHAATTLPLGATGAPQPVLAAQAKVRA